MRLALILALALAGFLTLGLISEGEMKNSARSMTILLRKAENELKAGRDKTALAYLRKFEDSWTKAEKTWALITDHHEMDQVHLAIDRADQFLSADSPANARAEISSLLFLVGHIPGKESFGIRSVL